MGPTYPSGRPPASNRALAVVVSCEHAGNEIPAAFQEEFTVPPDVLHSHRGIDFGSLDYGLILAARLGPGLRVKPLIQRATRLLVDTNRGEASPDRLSEFARAMPVELQVRAIKELWEPHRARVIGAVASAVEAGRTVLHLAAHSFTPVLDGQTRDVDVGILFDPDRAGELAFAERFIQALRGRRPDLRTHANRPYLGTSDCVGLVLRERHADECYAGIELEVSQRFPLDASEAGRRTWAQLQADLAAAVVTSLR
ncbi:MAG: putative N-formylglutamate amidohydrolase [Planctomycetota bacterium]